jgi:hypothetical protein
MHPPLSITAPDESVRPFVVGDGRVHYGQATTEDRPGTQMPKLYAAFSGVGRSLLVTRLHRAM